MIRLQVKPGRSSIIAPLVLLKSYVKSSNEELNSDTPDLKKLRNWSSEISSLNGKISEQISGKYGRMTGFFFGSVVSLCIGVSGMFPEYLPVRKAKDFFIKNPIVAQYQLMASPVFASLGFQSLIGAGSLKKERRKGEETNNEIIRTLQASIGSVETLIENLKEYGPWAVCETQGSEKQIKATLPNGIKVSLSVQPPKEATTTANLTFDLSGVVQEALSLSEQTRLLPFEQLSLFSLGPFSEPKGTRGFHKAKTVQMGIASKKNTYSLIPKGLTEQHNYATISWGENSQIDGEAMDPPVKSNEIYVYSQLQQLSFSVPVKREDLETVGISLKPLNGEEYKMHLGWVFRGYFPEVFSSVKS